MTRRAPDRTAARATPRSQSRARKTSTTTSPAPAIADVGHRYVVGIGASAGGLEALSALIGRLRGGLGMSYVVVQHLSPSYKSMLPQLLGRETSLPVVEIVHGQPPQPDTIYVTPPNRNVVLKDGRLELLQSPREITPKPSVNLFLSSLAEERREDAIGVILSGTGSDGSSGIRAVKAAGGFTFAQDPQTARYAGMPQSAIETGCVDWVQSPEGIADELARLSEARPVLPVAEQQELPLTALKRLLNKVRTRTKLDFSGYKESTLWRRVERRLFANRTPTLDSYLALVESQPEELERLAKDILISVTSFFRDRESFLALERVLKKLVERKQPGDEIRVWVPGCATGEEAYSIAIMLHRLLGGRFDQFRIQIFATDVDMDAMAIARRGNYAAALLGELDPELVQRYFRPVPDRFEISKSIRDVVIFARQDLVLDPPFLRLDLISCRNVLIYLQPALQGRILSLFHYALNPESFLFLGKSESVAQQDLLFVPESKEARIFRRRSEGHRSLPGSTSLPQPATGEAPVPSAGRSPQLPREQAIIKAASALYVPPSVVVNGNMQILHVLGDASNYLQIPAGKVSLDLTSLLVRDLKVEAQALLRTAEQKNMSVEGRQRLPLHGRSGPMIRLAVHPLEVDGNEKIFLVAFVPAETPSEPLPRPTGDAATGSEGDRRDLEDELIATREHLQTLVEELETSNEEMQALNEEVQAANEELQATNEELEAANEELQSTNEELLTINEELQIKSTELARTNTDLESIQDNVGMPIIVVDESLYIRRYNAAAEVLFKMHRGLIGESIDRLVMPKGMASLSEPVAEAIRMRQPKDLAAIGDGREYLLRITLMFVGSDKPSGAIVSLLEQTDLLRTSRLLQESEARLRAVLDRTQFLVAIKDVAGRYLYTNDTYARYFAPGDCDLVGNSDSGILPASVCKHFRDEELIAMRRRETIEATECTETLIGERWLAFSRFPLVDIRGDIYAICVQATDITEKRHAEEQLKLAARVIEGAAEAVLITDAGQRILTANEAFSQITGYALQEVVGKTPALLRSGHHDADFYRAMWETVNTQGVWQGEVESRRKNGDIFTEWLTLNAIRNAEGQTINYVAIFSDISSLREARRRLEFQAMHDPLTRLPNRALLHDRAQRAVARALRHQQSFALVFVDLDNFKDINDSLGHEYGDRILCEVAQRLQRAMREQDTVSRLGGDEFVILIDELREGEIETMVERCRSALALPLADDSRVQRVSASIGIAMYPDDGETMEELLKSADSAMYRAKQRGRDGYCFSSAEIRRTPAERLEMINGLRTAVDRAEGLSLVYQPILDHSGKSLVGLEALMRWHSPTLGEVPPQRFIALAEEIGLITQLGDWLADEVLRQISEWKNGGITPPRISLNVSPLQIRSEGLDVLLIEKLRAAALPPSAIGIEITESALGHEPRLLAATLTNLREAGIPTSLDDFGTGFSSLSRLSSLPIATLKIDRSFVEGLDDPAKTQDLEIARTIVVMAHSLGMTAIAEGVETERQLKVLRELGCDAIQGYLLARPMPADSVAAFMKKLMKPRRSAPVPRARKKDAA